MPIRLLIRPLPVACGLLLTVLSVNLAIAGVTGGAMAGLGTNPVAVVESITAPSASVQAMDLLFPGQTIALGASGTLTLSYLAGCRSEIITGGTVRVAADGASSDGGTVDAHIAPGCQGAAPVMRSDATEAGAVAVRALDIGGEVAPRIIRTPTPMFKWLAAGPAEIRILDQSHDPAELFWAGQGTGAIGYPQDAPKLKPNVIYRVEVHAGTDLVGTGQFMINPDAKLPDTLANRLVLIARP